MGYNIGMPVLKLNNVGRMTKHCGDFKKIIDEAFDRWGKDNDIDRSRSYLNEIQGMNHDELLKYSKAHIAELDAEMRKNSKNNRGLRKDAVVMVATIIQPPKEFLETLDQAQRIQFMKDCREILKDLVGPERWRSDIIHHDEQSEHLHMFWEPMTGDDRLCAKEVVNLKFYNKLNREFPERLRNKGWKDIDDCFAFNQAEYDAMTPEEQKAFWENKKKNGRSSKKYKADEDARKAEIKQLDQARDDALWEKSHAELSRDKIKDDIKSFGNDLDLLRSQVSELYIDDSQVPDEEQDLVDWVLDHVPWAWDCIVDLCRNMAQTYENERQKAKQDRDGLLNRINDAQKTVSDTGSGRYPSRDYSK